MLLLLTKWSTIGQWLQLGLASAGSDSRHSVHACIGAGPRHKADADSSNTLCGRSKCSMTVVCETITAQWHMHENVPAGCLCRLQCMRAYQSVHIKGRVKLCVQFFCKVSFNQHSLKSSDQAGKVSSKSSPQSNCICWYWPGTSQEFYRTYFML